MDFPTTFQSIADRIASINPIQYTKNRNFLTGAVTHLSPYITHGVITLPYVLNEVLKSYSKKDSYTFIFELAWREFFARTWDREGENIFYSMRHDQVGMKTSQGIPKKYVEKNTGITAIDESLKQLEEVGYVHNHARMWMAMLVTTVAKVSWWEGARHMYYHLLDGDRASNTLSWQWVAGTFSSKQYIANQEMINKYALQKQYNTFLDTQTELLISNECPEILKECVDVELLLNDEQLVRESIAQKDIVKIPTLLYSMWTLDPLWNPAPNQQTQKILFVDSDDLYHFPMSNNRISFFLALSKNILDIQLFYGSRTQLEESLRDAPTYRKFHPALKNWIGNVSAPEYLFPQVDTIPGGFMSYWKKCEQYL